MDFDADPQFLVIFGLVVLVRCVLPFTIFRFPLAGIIACLIVDGVDQTVFQLFGYDPPFYQSYDKAMDVFYLGIAYISTMRNWMSWPAITVSRALFFYRQFGVAAFELVNWRALLLIFPNTFEYFFIAYEAIRTRWNPAPITMRFWIVTAALIWIFIKLPQEYWIHIAQLDVTDTIRDVPWFGPAIVAGVLLILGVFWFVVRPRLPEFDHDWQFGAPPQPEQLATAQQRATFAAAHDRVWSAASLEKAALVGLLAVIFASLLPSIDVSPVRLVIWIGIFVVLNAAISLRRARRGLFRESLVAQAVTLTLMNLALAVLVDQVFYRALNLPDALFFALLFSVLVTVYDRYRPIYDLRFGGSAG